MPRTPRKIPPTPSNKAKLSRRLDDKREDGFSVTDERNLWRIVARGPAWEGMFRSFKRSAFRLKVLGRYDEPSEREPFQIFMKGGDPGRGWISGWCELGLAGTPQLPVDQIDLKSGGVFMSRSELLRLRIASSAEMRPAVGKLGRTRLGGIHQRFGSR
jgi:hypothetical protein